MLKLSPEVLAGRAAESWKRQYFVNNEWTDMLNHDSYAVYQALTWLGPNPTPEEVVSVINNDSWVSTECTSCKDKNIPVIVLGESESVDICEKCLINALALIKS